jgi:hypothetical protein
MNMDIDKKMDMDKNTRTHTWARRQLFNFNTYFLPGKSGDYFLSYSSCPHCKQKKISHCKQVTLLVNGELSGLITPGKGYR